MVDYSVVPTTETVTEIVDNIDDSTPKWLDYLPAIFHEEAERKESPLWALLWLMEDNFKKINDKIDEIDTYFDIAQSPSAEYPGDDDFLSLLGSWVGLVPKQEWTEEKKRYAVRQAANLHQYRGTAIGMSYMLALFFEIDVEVKEWVWPKAMQVGEYNTIGIDTRLHERPNINHAFVIMWKADTNGPELTVKIKNIRALIDHEKPAHTWCYLHVKR
jgi:phage tail-like protein